jgi:EGF-like domain
MCSRDYGIIKGIPDCSSNGICLKETSQCVCDAGWTSRTDFLTDYSYDCDINLTAIRALCGFSLVCNIICAIIASINIYRNLPITKKMTSDAKVMYSVVNLGTTLGAIIYNTLKLIDPIENILSPDKPAVIISWVLYQLFWWWACGYLGCIFGLFITNYTKIIPRAAEGSSTLINLALKACRNLPILTVTCAIFPIAYTISPINGTHILAAFTYYTALLMATIGFAVFILSNGFVRLLAKIIQEKDAASRPPGITLVYYLMLAVNLNVITGVFLVGPLQIPFGIMLFLRRKYIYMYLFLQIVWSSSGVCILYSQMKKKPGAVVPSSHSPAPAEPFLSRVLSSKKNIIGSSKKYLVTGSGG